MNALKNTEKIKIKIKFIIMVKNTNIYLKHKLS